MENNTTVSQPAAEAGKQWIATHDGVFHADEICAIIFLMWAHKLGEHLPTISSEVVRTRDTSVIAATEFVVDVGGVYDPSTNRFDHHQWKPDDPAGLRPSGKRWAAAGLVWREFGVRIVSKMLETLVSAAEESAPADASVPAAVAVRDDKFAERVAAAFDRAFVRHIDAADNGEGELGGYSISQAIAACNSPSFIKFSSKESEAATIGEQFEDALQLAIQVSTGAFLRCLDQCLAERSVRVALEASASRIVVLEEYVPWQAALLELTEDPTIANRTTNALLFVFPNQSGKWVVQCVAPRGEPFGKKLTTRAAVDGAETPGLPVEWASLTGAALVEVTGVPDAEFCHVNRFLAVASSKEGAMALAHAALKAAGYPPEEE